MNDFRTTIPYTELRAFYKVLRMYSSTHFHHAFAKEVAENANKLADQFCRSVELFKKYENCDEEFIGKGERKKLPFSEGEINFSKDEIKNTQDAAAHMKKGECTVSGHPELNFLYIDREIVPARTKDACFDADESSTRNRSADLLLRNADKDDARPIIGEVKVKGDANPFLALIQLLMHAAEMVTPNQVERLKKCYPEEGFQIESSDCPGYDLYLVMFGYNEHSDRGNKALWEDLLNDTGKIASKLVQQNQFSKYVRQIVCMDLPAGQSVTDGFKLEFKASALPGG